MMACNHCETIYCDACVTSWKKKNDKQKLKHRCPSCADVPFELKEIGGLAKKHLDNLKYSCFKCSDKFIYGDAAKHLNLCVMKREWCPAGCGKHDIKNEEGLVKHLRKCKNVIVSCNCCEA